MLWDEALWNENILIIFENDPNVFCVINKKIKYLFMKAFILIALSTFRMSHFDEFDDLSSIDCIT